MVAGLSHDRDGLQMGLSFDLYHARRRLDGDPGCLGNLLDQVLRHALLQRWPTHQQRDAAGVAGKVHGGLPGRIGPTNQVDVLVTVELRFAHTRTVVDACPL